MNKIYLIENTIKGLRGLDKRKIYFDDKRPGLVLVVHKQKMDNSGNDVSKKSWYFNYRPKGAKPQKIWLGNAALMSRAAAINKIKKIENDIFNNEDIFFIKQKLKEELSLGDLIHEFYRLHLLTSSYAEKYIKSLKSTFKVWIFQRPDDPRQFSQYFTYSIKDKKISKVKTRDILDMFNAAKAKSGYSANRLVAYLRAVFNWAIAENLYKGVNPCKIKGKQLFKELEANNILSEKQYNNILRLAFVVDERNGTINYDHYIQKGLNIIPCLAIVWCLLTGRRCSSEGFSIRFDQINYEYKIIQFEQSKVGQKNYKLSDKTLKLLNAILRSRQKNIVYPEKKYKSKTIPQQIKPSLWSYNDERREYIFPSNFYGAKSKTPHIVEVRSTWKKLLKLCGIKYLPLKQARHTFATLLLKRSKNLKAVQSQLGHAKITTTMKYAKLIDEDEFDAINQDSTKTLPEENIIEFKK